MGLTLLEKAIKGKKKAIKTLALKDSKFIYKLAYAYTKDEYDAIEIMRNTIVYIYDNIYRLNKSENLRKYTIKVTIKCVNEYFDEFEVKNKNEESIIKCLDKDGKIDMYKAIDLLEVDEKSIIILLFLYNMSYSEVSDILNIKEETVKIYLRNILKKLRNKIEGESSIYAGQ